MKISTKVYYASWGLKMAISKDKVINELEVIKDYFLSIQEEAVDFDNGELLKNLTAITDSIVFEQNADKKKIKINFLIFWLNYIIDNKFDLLSEELKVSISNIVSNLDLFQLESYLNSQPLQDNDLIFDIQTRKVFGDSLILTNSQMDIMVGILKNKNIIFSAPTSYGKSSIVITSLFLRLKSKEINHIAIIVPSKALINEYRKKINKLNEVFSCKIEINENPYIELNDNNQYVHLFTQERLLIFDQLASRKMDYVVFDEVQDLLAIGTDNSNRAILLAKAISICENKEIPMVFLMPYILDPEKEFINYFTDAEFLVQKNLHSPTTSNKYLIVKENNKYQLYDVSLNKGYSKEFQQSLIDIEDVYESNQFYDIKYDFYKICKNLNVLEDKSLCYCSKENLSSIAKKFQEEKQELTNIDGRLKALINYLEKYIHPNFELVNFLKKGIAIHLADLDTFTKRQIEECFKDPNCSLNMIFCTSTLLQGVNLNANNLFFLAQKGSFTNSELDKKNLFGRVGRIGNGSKLQGSIFKFWVENGQRTQKETMANELNSSGDLYKINKKFLTLDSDKIQKDEQVNSYYLDNTIKKKLPTKNPVKIQQVKVDNFDYFIGKRKSTVVDKQIKQMNQQDKELLMEKMKFTCFDDCEYILRKLCLLYEWDKSENFDEKYRMTQIRYLATVFYKSYLGVSVKKCIEDMINYNEDENSDYRLVMKKRQNGKEYPKVIQKMFFVENENQRLYKDEDINALVYSYIYETQNIIEFRVKKYLQDLYYRLTISLGKQLKSLEDYLIYSTANNKKKINLNKLGFLDSFAIDELISQTSLFEDDVPNVQKIINYAKQLPDDQPLKYAILDVLQ